ncbi:MAG: YidC/Oxa1 family membrane protein insertase [Actinomycetota bacterium]
MSIWVEFRGYFSDGLVALADFFSLFGTHRWAAAIVVLTIIVRTLLLPLAIKQIRSMREQQRLQPELQRLRQKHRSDRQKLTQETMELFRKEGVNPYSACLPMIAQAPVFIAMYQVIQKLNPPGGMPLLGLAELTEPARSSVGGWLLIAVMTIAQLLTTRQLNPGTTDQQRRLQMMMPVLFIFLFMGFPAGLVLYWSTQSLYQLIQQVIMTRNVPGAGLRLRELWPFGGSGDGKQKQRQKPQPRPQVAVPAVAGASGFEDADSRRALAEKRRRRRRKKKKRR